MRSEQIAIICWNKEADPTKKIFYRMSGKCVAFFYRDSIPDNTPVGCQAVRMPPEVDNQAKAKNFVINWHREHKFTGMLHVLEDTIEVLKDPTEFMSEIANMMDALDIHSYLGTVTDGCNRVYKKYNPRLRIKNDKEGWKEKLGFGDIIFCSHSNTQWMVFDLEKADDSELHFSEQFNIAMFWIIEYLARRRNEHPGTLYMMNQYITCESELGLYQNTALNISDEVETPEQMKKEDEMFKELKVNYAPDNNIDSVLEKVYGKLISKI